MSTIKKDLTDLPRAEDVPGGLTPDDDGPLAAMLLDRLTADREAEDPKPTAHGTRLRFSDAGNCARYLSYKAHGIEPTDPVGASGLLAFRIGTFLHDIWQEVLTDTYPSAEIEAKGLIEEADCSGSADAVIHHDDGTTTVVEVKSQGGFGYKLAVGARGDAQGPKGDHLYQLALNVRAHDADRGVIVYLAKEALSQNVASKIGADETLRCAAQWTIPADTLDSIADKEIARQKAILELVDDGLLAPKHIPDDLPSGARIVDVESGRWELREDGEILDTGSTWRCSYCAFQTLCANVTDAETPSVEAALGRDEDAA